MARKIMLVFAEYLMYTVVGLMFALALFVLE